MTAKEIYEDGPFCTWAVRSKYFVSHFVGVTPIYMNNKDLPEYTDEVTGDIIGQRCYTIEELYTEYELQKEKQ